MTEQRDEVEDGDALDEQPKMAKETIEDLDTPQEESWRVKGGQLTGEGNEGCTEGGTL